MPLDSTLGAATAESLCSVAEADAYHAARGAAAWAVLSEAVREQCLRRATDYMGQAYAAAWQGARVDAVQALDWPRSGVEAHGIALDAATLPGPVRDACAVLALKANAGPLAPDLAQRVKRQKVGPIETEYADYSPQSKRYLAVDRMLAPYLVTYTPFSARLERS